MTALRPFFSFFGSKWALAKHYPAPARGTIVEPFAGSAGYALNYPDREIVLVERDPIVAGLWKWLIDVKPADIESLPRLREGESLDDYDLPREAKWLMGFWINQTGARPNNKVTKFGAVYTTTRNGQPTVASRTEMYVNRVVNQLPYIRHWQVIEGDYTQAPDINATWFIDPPYQIEGRKYTYGPKLIDYDALGAWCRTRQGQVMVCENSGATWLPFQPFVSNPGVTYSGKRIISQEVIYASGTTEQAA